MFVAFSRKSPCATLAQKFGEGITAMTTDDRFRQMLVSHVVSVVFEEDTPGLLLHDANTLNAA